MIAVIDWFAFNSYVCELDIYPLKHLRYNILITGNILKRLSSENFLQMYDTPIEEAVIYI